MNTSFQYAYLFGDFVFLLVWLGLYIHRKDLRKKMLLMSVVGGIIGPLSELFYLRDYWNPQLIGGFSKGFEDVIFGFVIAGIAGVMYEEAFGRHFSRRHMQGHRKWMIGMPLAFIAWLTASVIGLGLNSIYASIIGFMAIGIVVLLFRHDLLSSAFFSGMLTGSLMLVGYILLTHIFPGLIQAWWQLDHISGVLVLGAPLEELMWGFSWGFLAGPIYEFANGIALKKE